MSRRFLVSFLALALSVVPALSQSLTLLGVGSSGSVAGPTITYIGDATCAFPASTCTVTNTNIGTAATDRTVIIGIDFNSQTTLTSVTIQGITSNIFVQTFANTMTTAFVGIGVPTGTTATVVITAASSQAGSTAHIGVWTVNGLNSLTPDNTQTASTSPCNITLTNVANGAAFMDTMSNATASEVITGTGFVQDYNVTYNVSKKAAGGHAPTTGTSLTLTGTSGNTKLCSGVSLH